MSRDQVIERIPETISSIGSTSLTPEQKRRLTIFEELGAYDGEAAVDYLFEKYGKSQGTYLPMVFAMRGWMERDMDAALEAFRGFLKNGKVGFVHNINQPGAHLFVWKGESFHSGTT